MWNELIRFEASRLMNLPTGMGLCVPLEVQGALVRSETAGKRGADFNLVLYHQTLPRLTCTITRGHLLIILLGGQYREDILNVYCPITVSTKLLWIRLKRSKIKIVLRVNYLNWLALTKISTCQKYPVVICKYGILLNNFKSGKLRFLCWWLSIILFALLLCLGMRWNYKFVHSYRPPPPVITEQPKSTGTHFVPYERSYPNTLESLAEKVHSFYPGDTGGWV